MGVVRVLCRSVFTYKDAIERDSHHSGTVQSLYERAIGGKKKVVLFLKNIL